MSFIQMRTVPALFVGRRTLVAAEAAAAEIEGATSFRCGACDSVIVTAKEPKELQHVVVKCGCGEFNQL
jgi:hypothetical protein